MLRYLVLAGFLSVSVALACGAQSSSGSSQSSQSQASTSSPASSSSAKPAEGKEQPPSDKDSAKATKKPKKVWTEDEVSKVGGNISVVGDPNGSATSSSNGQSSRSTSGKRDVTYYRNKLAPLRSQISEIDRQIQQMKGTLGVRENIDSQVEILQAKRAKIQAQIDEIEDEAHHDGIQPGDLR